MIIAIPSAGRQDRQVTLRGLQKFKLLDRTHLCVPEAQVRAYRNNVPQEVTVHGMPPEYRIAETHEWMMTELPRVAGDHHVFQVDDDMDFCYRPDKMNAKLLLIEDAKYMNEMLGILEGWLDAGFVHVGVSARQGNNRPFYDPTGTEFALHTYRDAARMNNAYAYDTKKLARIRGLDLARNAVMHDFDVTLQLLKKGYANRVMFDFCWNQRNSGARGGCSTYRTAEVQAKSAHQLKADHPEHVRLKVKASKPGSESWKDMKERVDVLVDWRKAFWSSGKKVEGQP